MALGAPFRQWLFRFGADDSVPLVLTRRRIFIVPTRAGLLFVLVLFVMLLGAINYNLSLGHALVFLLAGLGVVALLHTYRNLVRLRLTPGRSDPVFAGETAYFELLIDNPQGYHRRALDLCFANNAGIGIDVAAHQKALIAIPCPAPARGRLLPGRITLSSRYPLGLFRAWSTPHPRLACIVYPQPIATPLPVPERIARTGERHGGDGQEDFTGLRLRQPNDSPRHIAWKALARDPDNRPLLVKQFAGGGVAELTLDLAMLAGVSGLETQLSILSGWVIAAERDQTPYGLRLPGRAIAPGQGEMHRNACLEALALYGEKTG